jgi:hypothetical protein
MQSSKTLKIRVQYKIELQFQLTRIQSLVHSNSEFDRAICHARFFFLHQINVAHDHLLTMLPQNPLLHDVHLCTETWNQATMILIKNNAKIIT